MCYANLGNCLSLPEPFSWVSWKTSVTGSFSVKNVLMENILHQLGVETWQLKEKSSFFSTSTGIDNNDYTSTFVRKSSPCGNV